MSSEPIQRKINWYRTPIDRDTLAALNQRSDLLGALQTLGHLGLLVLSGAAAFYAAANWPVWALLAILFVHGTMYAFLLNGFHELCHSSVFKTKALNTLFLNIFSFLGGFNPVMFWASHQEHHKYTLHQPDDLEVVLPVKITMENFWKSSFINPWGLIDRTKGLIRLSRGILMGQWENHLFPANDPAKRQRLFNWARLLLFGHLAIVLVCIPLGLTVLPGLWLVPVLTTFAPFYGGLALFLCNNTQHVGLQDDAPDFRLCTRTIYLNPILRFLYWHMNFHIEHHMYAAVPCYNLGKLHAAIKHDLPHIPNGLAEAWGVIIPILKKQQVDPTYEFVPELPRRAAA